MVIVVPKGRGNWRRTTLQIDDRRAQPLLIRPGQVFELGGVRWRIVEVRP